MDIESLRDMFNMHIKECDDRDQRNAEAVKDIKSMFKGIWDAQDKMRDGIVALQIKIATFLGGFMVVIKIIEMYVEHKKST